MDYIKDVLPRIVIGAVIKSRTGREYIFESADEKGFCLRRPGKDSTQRITAKKILRSLKELNARGYARFQRSPRDGGFSYTVTEEIGIVWALGDRVTVINNQYQPTK